MITRKSGNEQKISKQYLNSSNSNSWFWCFVCSPQKDVPEGPSMLRPYQLAKGGDENPQKNWGNTWIRYTNNLWSFFFWLRNIWCSDLLFLLFLNRVWDAIGSWAVSRSTFGGRLEDNIPPQNHGSFSEHPHPPHSKENEWSGTPSPGRYPTVRSFHPRKLSRIAVLQQIWKHL